MFHLLCVLRAAPGLGSADWVAGTGLTNPWTVFEWGRVCVRQVSSRRNCPSLVHYQQVGGTQAPFCAVSRASANREPTRMSPAKPPRPNGVRVTPTAAASLDVARSSGRQAPSCCCCCLQCFPYSRTGCSNSGEEAGKQPARVTPNTATAAPTTRSSTEARPVGVQDCSALNNTLPTAFPANTLAPTARFSQPNETT